MNFGSIQQFLVTVGQASQPAGGTGGSGGRGLTDSLPLIIGVVLMMFVFIFVSGRGKRKEQQSREQMLAGLGKNDKVVTIGGMVGVITDVKDDELTIKIDEGTNTKIRMKKWAVRAMESKEGGEAADKK